MSAKELMSTNGIESLHIHFAHHNFPFLYKGNDFFEERSIARATVHHRPFQNFIFRNERIKLRIAYEAIEIVAFSFPSRTSRCGSREVPLRGSCAEFLEDNALPENRRTDEEDKFARSGW